MEIVTRIDQNRIDYCVELVNRGFVHIGTIWDQYDIYYNPETNYTYEVCFPVGTLEYKVHEYIGKHSCRPLSHVCLSFTENTGDGCMVDYFIMRDGKVIGVTDDCVCVSDGWDEADNEEYIGIINL